MATEITPRERIFFGEFEIDCRTGDLRRNGSPVKLQPQPAKVLNILVKHAGEVVTRNELAEQLWGAETYVDFEHGLNFAVRQIRSVLEDSADQPKFLETIPTRGYRFIGQIHSAPLPKAPTSTAVDSGLQSRPHNAFLRYVAVMTLILVAGSAVFLAIHWSRSRAASAGSGLPIRSVAVLPLHNLSLDPEQEYFSDGMTDELITSLAKFSGLRAISHTSVERYKKTKQSLPEVARELGVDAIVEGTILRSGDRIRITAQLIDAHSDQHL